MSYANVHLSPYYVTEITDRIFIKFGTVGKGVLDYICWKKLTLDCTGPMRTPNSKSSIT
jgi:hypothetical protein